MEKWNQNGIKCLIPSGSFRGKPVVTCSHLHVIFVVYLQVRYHIYLRFYFNFEISDVLISDVAKRVKIQSSEQMLHTSKQ